VDDYAISYSFIYSLVGTTMEKTRRKRGWIISPIEISKKGFY